MSSPDTLPQLPVFRFVVSTIEVLMWRWLITWNSASAGSGRQPSSSIYAELGIGRRSRLLPLDRAEANMVFQLVSRRYDVVGMIITSNKSFAKGGQVLGDDVLATAILDQLLHHCDIPAINGHYRLKDGLALAQGGEPMS